MAPDLQHAFVSYKVDFQVSSCVCQFTFSGRLFVLWWPAMRWSVLKLQVLSDAKARGVPELDVLFRWHLAELSVAEDALLINQLLNSFSACGSSVDGFIN